MTILNFEDFMKKHILKNDTVNESELQRVYQFPFSPRYSKLKTDKGFAKIDNGSHGGKHWDYFLVKDNNSFFFDSFGGAPGKFFKQLPKQKIYNIYKTYERYKFSNMSILLLVFFLFN